MPPRLGSRTERRISWSMSLARMAWLLTTATTLSRTTGDWAWTVYAATRASRRAQTKVRALPPMRLKNATRMGHGTARAIKKFDSRTVLTGLVAGHDFSRAEREGKTVRALAPEGCPWYAREEAEALGTHESRKEDAGPSTPLKNASLRMTASLAGRERLEKVCAFPPMRLKDAAWMGHGALARSSGVPFCRVGGCSRIRKSAPG